MKRKAARKSKAATAKKRGGKSKVVLAKKPRKRQAPTAAKTADPIDGLVAASAQALGLTIDPAWYGGVKFNLQLILRIGALVDEFSLPDYAEPAPVFHA
jgi:hypothetical protein